MMLVVLRIDSLLMMFSCGFIVFSVSVLLFLMLIVMLKLFV